MTTHDGSGGREVKIMAIIFGDGGEWVESPELTGQAYSHFNIELSGTNIRLQ